MADNAEYRFWAVSGFYKRTLTARGRIDIVHIYYINYCHKCQCFFC